jgi:hypothetical protein
MVHSNCSAWLGPSGGGPWRTTPLTLCRFFDGMKTMTPWASAARSAGMEK